MNRKDCFGRRDDVSHILVCPDCRTDARMAGAWRALRLSEAAAPVDDAFVERTAERVRRDRAAVRRRRFLTAVAAAALFSFFAGLAHETARRSAPEPDESYASLSAPAGELSEFLPN